MSSGVPEPQRDPTDDVVARAQQEFAIFDRPSLTTSRELIEAVLQLRDERDALLAQLINIKRARQGLMNHTMERGLAEAIDAIPDVTLAHHDQALLAPLFDDITGCGDHGCLIEPPEGMGTNGGCRCPTERGKASLIVQRAARQYQRARQGVCALSSAPRQTGGPAA